MQGLTKTYADPYGSTYPAAYYVISWMNTHYDEQRCTARVSVFINRAALDAGRRQIAFTDYLFCPQSYQREDGVTVPAFSALFPAAIQAGYGIDIAALRSWLLTTPELAGAT